MKTLFRILLDAIGEQDTLLAIIAIAREDGEDGLKRLTRESDGGSARDLLAGAFTWSKSEQGASYWAAIHDGLLYDRDKYTARAESEERRWIVRCIAPTHYQIPPVNNLMGVSPKQYGHNYIADSQVFDTEEEAEEWLLGRAEHLFFHGRLDEEEYMGSHEQVREYGRMTYDGATAIIVCINTNGEVVD